MKLRERGSAPFVVWCLAVAASIVAGVAGGGYVFSGHAPFESGAGLAPAIAGTSAIATFVKNFADLIDALAWNGWTNRTQFAFSPMTIYLAAVPLAKLFGGNAFTAIKAIQFGEVALAWVAAAALYRRLRGPTPWAWVAGGLYALLPVTLLWIRASVEVGAIGALTPLGLAAILGLLRRWGAWALPLCAVIAAVVTEQVVLAYGCFAGLPIYAFACGAAFDRKHVWRWVVFSAAGVACGIGSAAFVLLPTLGSRAIFSPPLSIHALLQIDAGHLSFLLGPFAVVAVALGVAMWALAAGWAVWAARARALATGEAALLAMSAICTALAFTVSDRFLTVAAVVVAVAAASALERLCSDVRFRAYATAGGGLAVAAGVASLFALHVFAGDSLAAAPSAPPMQAGRAGTIVWRDASPAWQLGAFSMPYSATQTDVAQRYADDGLGGLGILARSNVTMLVDANGAARPLDGRGWVRRTIPMCFFGGPGLLDRLVAMDAFANVSFFGAAFSCTHALYADSAPVERAFRGQTIEAFDGRTLFPRAAKIVGADDRAPPNGFFINDPWYRNAIDGDTPNVGGGAVAVHAGDTASTLFITNSGPYALAVHVVCHAAVAGHVLRDATFRIPFACSPRQGFQWMSIPFGKIGAGEHSYSITFDSIGTIAASGGWETALDGVLLLSTAKTPVSATGTAFAFSASRLDESRWIAAGSYRTSFAGQNGAAIPSSLSVDGVPAASIVTFARSRFHRLHWTGDPQGVVIALVPTTWKTVVPQPFVERRASARWSLVVAKRSTIEVAQFPDGDWRMVRDGLQYGGSSCDLVNTCFVDLDAGRYELVHHWPGYVVFGFLATLAAWLAAGLLLLYAWRRETTAFDLQKTIDTSCPLTYFAYLGAIVAVVCAITFVNYQQLGELGWMMAKQLVAIAFLTVCAAGVSIWQRSSRPAPVGEPGRGLWLLWLGIGGVAVCAIASLVLDFEAQRLYLLFIAVVEALAIVALHPGMSRRTAIWLGFGAAVAWSLTSGLMFTHLADFLLNGDPTTALAAVAFVAAFGFVIYALRESEAVRENIRTTIVVSAIAGLVFAAFALRTDALGTEWIPIHRSYFSDVSQFVRDGHWILWDVPTLYGFLSMVTLALIPAKDGWQALFELTALFLVVEAGITFLILRWGRGGWSNSLFAILFPLATIFGDAIARHAVSGRLYPQGGLRFFWIDVLILALFLSYVWRERPRRVAALRWIGHVVWITALLWAFECGAWTTAMWLPYLVVDALTTGRVGWVAALGRLVRNFWPIAVLPVVAVYFVDLFYKSNLGHLPDWRSYAEFTGLFTSGKIRLVFHVQFLGAGWTLLVILGALGALAIVAVRERRWDLVKLLTGVWFAVWATSSYFAVEPLDMYISLLFGITAPAAAIAIFASREGLRDRATSMIARYSLAPVAILAMLALFGAPSRIAAMKFPFTPGWTFDVKQGAMPVSGELLALMKRAGIRPGDDVVVPNGPYWTEPTQGMIQAFERTPSGMVPFRPWLPVSPFAPNMLYDSLEQTRKEAYNARFLDATHRGGWYVTYRKPASCVSFSPHLRTVSTVKSANFAISRCEYRP